jgi:hypothetical protein
VFYLFPLLLWIVVTKDDGNQLVFRRTGKPTLWLSLLIGGVIWLNVVYFANLLTSRLSFLSRYQSYLQNGDSTHNISFFLFFGVSFAGLVLMTNANQDSRDTKALALIGTAFLGFPLYGLQTVQTEFIRLSYYALLFFIAGFAYSCRGGVVITARYDHKRRFLLYRAGETLFLIGIVAQFVWWYGINNYFENLPYKSAILGI